MPNEEILATLTSLRQARRMLDELAIEGNYEPKQFDQYSVVYEREGGQRMEIRRKAKRQWDLVRVG